jgi:chemotaxis protein CheX
MQTQVSVEILTQIVQSVFITMMDIEVQPCDAPWSATGDRMTALVYLTGDWNGAIIFECNPQMACHFAGRILCMDPPESVDDDVSDVLGELANMIGGNMKSGMSLGIRLSMPSVMNGRDYDLRVIGAEVQERLAFKCESGNFWVTVLGNKE